MAIAHEQLRWDSNFFGYSVAKIRLNDFNTSEHKDLLISLELHNCHLAYLIPEDAHSLTTLKKLGYSVTDTKVVFRKESSQFNKTQTLPQIKSYDGDSNKNTILNLAILSGQYSRFKLDKKFKNDEFSRLYTEWFNKSIDRSIADEVLVYYNGAEPLGFVTYIIKGNCLNIGLLAVSEKAQGMGIGKRLMEAVENLAIANEAEAVIVPTQEINSSAMKFYLACNYQIKSKTQIIHLWMIE